MTLKRKMTIKFGKYFRPTSRPISAGKLEGSMSMSIWAGAIGTLWIATYVPEYILNIFFKNHLGGSAFLLGLMVALIHFTNVFHLVEIPIYSRLVSLKPFWYLFHIIHRLLGFAPAFVTLYIINGGDRQTGILVFIISLTLSFSVANTSSSGWYAWMSDLIPENIRASFFGRRVAVTKAVSMVWFFLVMLFLDIFSSHVLTVFTVVFIIAALGGVIDIVLHVFIPEKKNFEPREPIKFNSFIEPLKNENFRRFFLSFMLYMLSNNILAPFLGPYLTGKDTIGAPNIWLGLLVINTQLATIATMSQWGIIMDRFGRKPVVLLGSLSYLAGIGWFLLTSSNYALIIPFIAIITGIGLPVFLEGINQLMLTITPQKNKTTYISWFMAFAGIANGTGSLLGGILYDMLAGFRTELWSGFVISSFHIVVLANLCLCTISVLILFRIKEGGEKPIGFVVSRIASPGILKTFSNMSIITKPTSSDKVVKALRDIEGSSGSLALTEVMTRLDDPNTDVRKEAAEALGRIQSPDSVEALIERLNNADYGIQQQAAKALGKIGDKRALPSLIACLDSSSEEVQTACIEAIGNIGDKSSVKQLLGLLDENHTERVVTQSAEVVSQHGIIEAAWFILPRMHNTSNPILRKQLAIAFGNLIGKPGEFYPFITSEQAKSSHLNKLFTEIIKNINKNLKNNNNSRILKNLTILKKLFQNDSFNSSVKILYNIMKDIIEQIYGQQSKNDEAMLYYTIYRDTKLGLAFWFLKEVRERLKNIDNKELLKTDILLVLYFLGKHSFSPQIIKGSKE